MLVLPADLTRTQASASLLMLVQGLRVQGEDAVVVDARALEKFDSAALAVLLELRREGLAHGKAMRFRGLPQRLRDLAQVYGIAELLPAE